MPLAPRADIAAHIAILSPDEQERVQRFYYKKHAERYAVAHAVLRRTLAGYLDADPRELRFLTGEHGKPELAALGRAWSAASGSATSGSAASGSAASGGAASASAASRSAAHESTAPLHFNLSHSGDLALIAVSQHSAVGVDVERWRDNVEHLEIAERFFSPYERDALRALSGNGDDSERMLRGFFSTWSRKEAYLKATGHGISRGLHHFDVTLERADALALPTELLADRLDPDAVARWHLSHVAIDPGYSAALVAGRTSDGTAGAVVLYESPYI